MTINPSGITGGTTYYDKDMRPKREAAKERDIARTADAYAPSDLDTKLDALSKDVRDVLNGIALVEEMVSDLHKDRISKRGRRMHGLVKFGLWFVVILMLAGLAWIAWTWIT